MRKSLETFNDRYPALGPSLWILCIQYFITQYVVALAWHHTYSWSQNTISDLGNNVCAVYNGRYVCSPMHGWMNFSFILLGLFMMLGSGLIYHEFIENKWDRISFILMGLGGFGTVLVGLFPENTIGVIHFFGAFLPFFLGNLSLIIIGIKLAMPKPMRIYTGITGAVALIGSLLFITHTNLSLGTGGIERLAAYPQTIWLIVFGLYMSSRHYKNFKRMSKAHQT